MELIGYFAALGAATCWAFGSMLSVGPVRQLGPIPFNALRMLMVASFLTLFLVVTNRWNMPATEDLGTLFLSGFIGIFLGDTLLFTAVKILGPRMAGLLFACNAPISFAFGAWLLGEQYVWLNVVGVIGVMGGVFLAIAGRSKAGGHQWEQTLGHSSLGILAGFGAAFCQSMGTLLIYKIMKAGQDPIFATMLRVWVAVIFLSLTVLSVKSLGGIGIYRQLTKRTVRQIFISGFLGMGVGMSLLLWGVNLASLGIVSILSATTPIILLPLVWFFTKERPSRTSFIAAAIVVVGTSLIFVAS
ncbi:DMT family transporter [Reinekea sp.]|uniref:DMT family transporter n=1 Tax=Reinekea sp. TaxID=1970455 RepID=UPI003988D16A